MKKKILILVALLPMLFFSSCEKKEKEIINPMLGVWKLSSFSIDGKEMLSSKLIDMVGMECIRETTLDFKDNLIAVGSSCEENAESNYTFTETSCCLSTTIEGKTESLCGDIVDNVLTIDVPIERLNTLKQLESMGVSFDAIIVKLTKETVE